MPDELAALRRAAARRRRADQEYGAALVAAYNALAASGDTRPFARIADAAGIARQTARKVVRARLGPE